MKKTLCTTHSNNYDKLEKIIINSLKEECLRYINKKTIKEVVMNNINKKDEVSTLKDIKMLEEEVKRINDNLDNIYLDKLNNKITIEQFDRLTAKLNNELKIKKDKLVELNYEKNNQENTNINNQEIEEYINKFLSMDEPSRELIVNLIDRIEIYEDKTINVKVTFNKV